MEGDKRSRAKESKDITHNHNPRRAISIIRRRETLKLPQQITDSFFSNIHEHFSLHQEIGRGAFGVVFECTEIITGEKLACKSIPKSKIQNLLDLQALQAEIEILKVMQASNHVVKLCAVFEDSSVSTVCNSPLNSFGI